MKTIKDPHRMNVIVELSEVEVAQHKTTVMHLALQHVAKALAEKFMVEHEAAIMQSLKEQEVAQAVAARLLGEKDKGKESADMAQQAQFAQLKQLAAIQAATQSPKVLTTTGAGAALGGLISGGNTW